MDKQREIFEALRAEFSERFKAEGERITLNLEGQGTYVPPGVAEAITKNNQIAAAASRAQTEAILSAVATVIARYISHD